jgi:hypothetical protein
VLVAVEGHRWAIEDGFEAAKNELGLDHNESRSWHRHVSLVMLAFAMMAAIRRHATTILLPKKRKPRSSADLCPTTDPLVAPGNPPYRHQARAAADPSCSHHCLITLAKSTSGRRTKSPHQI